MDDARNAFDAIKKRLESADPAPSGALSGNANHSMLMRTDSSADRKTAEIMLQQLQAELWLSEGKQEQALALLAQTATEEDGLSFEFGPPMPIKPAHELYAEALLAAHRPKEAREEFQRALARAPKRAQSLLGLAKAAAASGDPDLSRSTEEDLKSFWHGDVSK
jgi:tetratricopeptide (TPR) repeat protein